MKRINRIYFFVLIFVVACNSKSDFEQGSFGYDLAFLQNFIDPIVLSNAHSNIILSAEFQGRVMTSSFDGLKGKSNGWINYEFIKKNVINKGGNPYGGEDRFWLAPIGSKYSLFYNGKAINDENWYIPEAIDAVAYNCIQQSSNSVVFQKELRIKNNVNTVFKIDLQREIRLFSIEEIEKELAINLSKTLKVVGFQSKNTITNLGEDWTENKGVISPWILGMFKGNNQSIAIFPYQKSETNSLMISSYLANLDSTKLKITPNAVLYKTDGNYRSKIGLKPANAKNIIGNYDAKNNVLTIVSYSLNKMGRFLNTSEEENDEVFLGDVINSYNNSSENGNPTFFELETASEGLVLKNGASNTHFHRTFHFSGSFTELNAISVKLLGISLVDVKF